MEKWKTIDEYPNYQVSNMGRVKSLNYKRTGKEKILKSCKYGGGYLYIHLYKEGKRESYLIHRLVASSFLDNPNNFLEVNHIDEDKTNNRVENLEWCDRTHNINFGTRNKKVAKSLSIPILQFSKKCEFVRRWESATEVENELGFQQNHISACCRGKQKTAYGYKWGYEKDYEQIKFNVFDLTIYQRKVA